MQRRASTWRLSTLARAPPRGPAAGGDGRGAAFTLVADIVSEVAQAPWGVTETTLRWLAAFSERYDVSEALLRATVADADLARRFSGAYDLERGHFERFLRAAPDAQRAAAARFDTAPHAAAAK